MNRDTLQFAGNSFSDYLTYLANLFDVEIKDDTITIPDKRGTGFIKNIILEDGLGVRYYSFKLKDDLKFNIFYDDDDQLVYRVLYFLSDNSNSTLQNLRNNSVVMYSSEVDPSETIEKNTNFCRLAIVFTSTWLENNYEEAKSYIGKLTKSLIQKNKPTIVSREIDSESYILAKQIASAITNNTFPKIKLKIACMVLLNEFLNRVVVGKKDVMYAGQSIYYENMLEVEKKIVESIKKDMPKLEDLAKEYNLSLSTLKRHFKVVFSKNIFEYYQEKRLLWGKNEIEKGYKNINEIAYELGFKKVNSFSKAFYKQFHVLPRELKHKKVSL